MRYVAALDAASILEATRQTHSFWGNGRSLEEHTAYNLRQLSEAGPELLRYVGLTDDAGSLCASIKRYSLQLSSPAQAGRTLRAVGIGAVFTRPDARGRGHASALLAEVLREAADLGYAAAWLYSDIAPSIYERLGFVAMPAVEHVAPLASLPREGALSTRPVPGADVLELGAPYEQSFEPGVRWLRPVRSRAAFRYFCWRNGVRSARWLHDGGRRVGYVIASPVASTRSLWVDEWSAPGVPVERVWATLRELAVTEDLGTVTGWLRPDAVGPPFTAAPRAEAIPMVAALDGSWRPEAVPRDHAHFGSIDHF